MALGTAVSISQVQAAIGCSDGSLQQLCTYAGINRWSKCRPGYWYIDTSVTPPKVSFRAPRGGGYADPRGTDSALGSDRELYKLGDFRGYRTVSEAPAGSVDGAATLNLTVNDGDGSLAARTFSLDLGEVDWFNEDGLFRARNSLGHTMTRIVLCHISGGQLVQMSNANGDSELPLTSVVLSSGRRTYAVPLYVPSPASAGQTVRYVVYPCIADDTHIYGYFDGISKTVNITRAGYPYIQTVAMDETCAAAIFAMLTGTSGDTTLYGINCTLSDSGLTNLQSGDTITVAASNVSIFNLEGYPSHNLYTVTSPRWTYTYRIEVYDSSGTLLGSGTGTYRAAVTGGKPAMHFTVPTLPAGYLRHGDRVRIYITDIGSTRVSL